MFYLLTFPNVAYTQDDGSGELYFLFVTVRLCAFGLKGDFDWITNSDCDSVKNPCLVE